MKLKLNLSIAFVLLLSAAYCSSADSLQHTKPTSHFQLLIGNYVGQSFTVNYHDDPSNMTAPRQMRFGLITGDFGGQFYYKPSFTPMYSYSVGFEYKADLSEHMGIRTGLNYFTYAYIAEGLHRCLECDWGYSINKYRRVVFMSSFHVPVHLVVYKPLKKGRFVFAAGPDLYLPINTFGKETISSPPSTSTSEHQIHYHATSTDFFKDGSLGFSLGLGYEKVLSKKFSIELLPDVHVMNLMPLDFQGQGINIYKNYIFNTAIGMSTYLTFTK